MLQIQELEEIIKSGEDSGHQFKQNFTNATQLAAEIVAFSNGNDGKILIGVKDDGEISGLNKNDISRLNQLISNVLSFAQSSAIIHADKTLIEDTGEKDIDKLYFNDFFTEQYGNSPGDLGISFAKLLENIYLSKNGKLNLAGVLLFSKQPQMILPSFIIKAVAFAGTDITDTNYLDSRDISGKLEGVFNNTISFLVNNTKTFQGEQSVNSIGIPEIPRVVFEELIANALIHRDYFINAPIRVLVFNNRIEIISPGHLPNNLTVENILYGNSNIRNPIIASFAAKILPYRGLGSGILRSVKAYPKIEFKDDRNGNLFVATVWR